MNVLDAIKSRKSIRNFSGEQISDEQLQSILTAAQAAPVGMAAYESLILTVITNKKLLEKIDKNAQASFGRDGDVLYGAPMLIVVSTKLTGTPRDNVAYSNAAGIVENMALEAVELGVGACHIWGAIGALNQNAELLKQLNLPEGFTPVCAVALGKTQEKYTLREIPQDRIVVNSLK